MAGQRADGAWPRALDDRAAPGTLHVMRNQLRPFLLGFGIAFGGWFLVILIRPESEALLLVPVVLGLIAALVARRPIALLGAVSGFAIWYVPALAVGQEPGDGWGAIFIVFPVLIATGFASGMALRWLRAMRAARAERAEEAQS